MEKVYLITNDYIKIFEVLNLKYERIFKKLDIPIVINKKGYYISRKKYVEIMDLLFDESHIDNLIDYCEISKLKMFIPPIFAGLCANNGVECFNRISKFKKLFGPFILDINQTKEYLSLEFKFEDDSYILPKFTQLTEMLLMVNLIRQATGIKIVPLKVESTFNLPSKVRNIFNLKEKISDKCVLYFKIEDVFEPFITENNTMWNYLQPEFIRRLEELKKENNFSSKVRNLIVEELAMGVVNIERVASELGLSSRSVQRRLKEENTTYISELNQVRQLLAKNYLLDPSRNTKEIAFLIGYSDEYVFMRAFRGWTGLTVTQYRSSHLYS